MVWSFKRAVLPASLLLMGVALGGCMQAPDMSGIAKERVRSVQRYDNIQALAGNDKVVVAGTQSGAVLVSSDQAKTWQRVMLGQSSLVDIKRCGDKGFVAIDHYRKVWHADAEGQGWKSVDLERPKTPIAITCDSKGGWWVAGINSVIAGSADQGQTWQITDFGEDTQITTIQFTDEMHAVALGEFGLTVFSEDGGKTWAKGPKIGGDFYPYAALFRNKSEGWASGIAGQMLETRDGGKSWTKMVNKTPASFYRLFMQQGVPFAVGSGGVIARLEGNAWREVPYTDAVPVFLGAGASLAGQPALVIGGPGGLVRAVGTAEKQ